MKTLLRLLGFGPSKDEGASDAYRRGCTHMKTCQFDQAIAAFSEAIQINPKYSKAYVSRGDANLLKGDFGSAIADFSEVLRRKSNDAEVYKAEELGHRLDSAAGRPRTNASGAKEL